MTPVHDARTTVLDRGALAVFHDAGVLGLADLHVASALMGLATGQGRPAGPAVSGPLAGAVDVPLAIALTVRALREGSVCLTLTQDPSHWLPAEPPEDELDVAQAAPDLPWPRPDAWTRTLQAHPLVAAGPMGDPRRPLRLVGDRLYLQRYWVDEQLIAAQVQARARTVPVDATSLRHALDRLFPDPEPDAQRLAAAMAATRAATIITGGPGTGKTTTVARLLAVLRELDPQLSIALAAPTGKAAARLAEAIAESVDRLSPDDQRRVGHPSASTLHRLLGWDWRNHARFRHNAGNPLPHDVVIVDECSMVALPLMARLLEAVRPDARLVLVGDADQLASVEAGAVLDDLVAAAPPWLSGSEEQQADLTLQTAVPREAAGAVAGRGVVRLDRVRRFGGRIAELSTVIRGGDPDALLALLAQDDPEGQVTFFDSADPAQRATALRAIQAEVVDQSDRIARAAAAGDVGAALAALDASRVLCAHRRGPDSLRVWNDLIQAWVAPPRAEWFPGRTILVNRNDRIAGVANGDTGVTVTWPDGSLRVAFPRGNDPLVIAPGRLEQIETLRALTIHRAQGSQFGTVTVVLPTRQSPLMTRELLYTAVTRAQERVRILGTPATLAAAVTTRVRRASGLREATG